MSDECPRGPVEPLVRTHPSESHIVPLADCPLCGAEAHFIECVTEMVWLAQCKGCGLILGDPSGYASRLDLCNDWNRRVSANAVLSGPARKPE